MSRMKLLLLFNCLLISFCLCFDISLGKTESNGTTSSTSSANVKSSYTTRDYIRDLVISLTSDGTANSTSSISLKPFQRDVKASTSSVSLLSYGNLALLGAVVLGGLAYVAPTFSAGRRAGQMPPMHPVYPQRFFDSMADFSADMIPYLENEIQHHQQGAHFYKRNKRSAGQQPRSGSTGSNDISSNSIMTEERLNIHDYLSRRLIALSESIMVWVERSLDTLPNLPRLEAHSCMLRSVCEAHNNPKKYGLSGLALQLLFPPMTEDKSGPSRHISKYQKAANVGRTGEKKCSELYDDCILNFLDVIQAVTNFIF